MSLDNDTARMAVSADNKGDAQDTQAHDFAVLACLARCFKLPYTQAAVSARLPIGVDLASPDGLARGCAALGLKSQLICKDVSKIDQIALPYVVFKKRGPALVVTEVSPDGRTALVAGATGDGSKQQIPISELQKDIGKGVFLVSPDEDVATRRIHSDTKSKIVKSGHWFWTPVRANWRNWMQITLAAFLLNSLSLALPLFVMNVYDKVIPNLAYVTLWTLAVGVGIAFALDMILRTLRGSLIETVSRRVDLKVASALFWQAMQARLLDRPGGAAGIANTIRDFEVVREFFASATFVALIDFLFIGLFIAALFFVVGPIAMVPLVAVPIVLTLALLAQVPLGRAATRAQQMGVKRQTVLTEALAGIETVKSLNAEPLMQKEWEDAVAASSNVNGRTRFWSGIASNGTMLVQQAVSVCIIVWGVFLVADGAITIGALIAANILAGRVLAPLGTIAQTIFRMQYARQSLSALNSFMALQTEQHEQVSSDAQVSRGSVTIDRVSYTYPKSRVPALKDLSMTFQSGESVALLGRVGSGKSTLGKVISGLIPADDGVVLVDGIALDQYDPAELRRGIGYLPQSPELFTGTLRENLTIGAPHATDEDVQRALYFAAMDEFASSTPEGLDLFLGERGMHLSGGQRQGIALARLLVRKPRTLFLDEPTNAMDQKMQDQIVTRLSELNREGVGMMVSTHRQSLAAMTQRLVVMEQGRAVLDGARDDVLSQLRNLKSKQVE